MTLRRPASAATLNARSAAIERRDSVGAAAARGAGSGPADAARVNGSGASGGGVAAAAAAAGSGAGAGDAGSGPPTGPGSTLSNDSPHSEQSLAPTGFTWPFGQVTVASTAVAVTRRPGAVKARYG
jgi:hypothetical protein